MPYHFSLFSVLIIFVSLFGIKRYACLSVVIKLKVMGSCSSRSCRCVRGTGQPSDVHMVGNIGDNLQYATIFDPVRSTERERRGDSSLEQSATFSCTTSPILLAQPRSTAAGCTPRSATAVSQLAATAIYTNEGLVANSFSQEYSQVFRVVVPHNITPGQEFQVNVSIVFPSRIHNGNPNQDVAPAGLVTTNDEVSQMTSRNIDSAEIRHPSSFNHDHPIKEMLPPASSVDTNDEVQQLAPAKDDSDKIRHDGERSGPIPGAFSIPGPGQDDAMHSDDASEPEPEVHDEILLSSTPTFYGKDGWARRIQASSLKFQWIRFDQQGEISGQQRFSAGSSAFVRKLDITPAPESRPTIIDDENVARLVDMNFSADQAALALAHHDNNFQRAMTDLLQGIYHRDRSTGSLYLVPSSEASVNSFIGGGPRGRNLVSYRDIITIQAKTFNEKAEWFKNTCRRISVDWCEGHIKLKIRRSHLLLDSMSAVLSLSTRDLRKTWKFEFIDEPGLDAMGLTREWFQLVTEEIFNPDFGLWQQSSVNQMCLDINPASALCHPADYLEYYRFFGRVMGKALFEQQLVSGYMVPHLYKHILGWPVTFEDLQLVDESICRSLERIMEYADNAEHLCLNFTVCENFLGEFKEVPLVKNGENIEVLASNLPEYIECRVKYHLLERVKPQLTELLLGFFDVIDEALLNVFDFQELELLMCGLPEINTVDWQENTEYTGEFESLGSSHPVCQWFWEVVEEHDQEYRARLLQFATGKLLTLSFFVLVLNLYIIFNIG